MARANGQGRNWARILCTVLFGLATLELIRVRPQYPGGYLAHFAVGGQVYSVIHSVFGATVLGLIVPVLLWLTGLAAVWLLWRPASGAFFKPHGAPAAWLPGWKPDSCQVPPEADASGPQIPEIHQPADIDVAGPPPEP